MGCGKRLCGNVNTDLHVIRLKPSQIQNFIKATFYSLPFATQSVDTVVCREVLEHLEDPLTALKELIRVSNRVVIIETPHRRDSRYWNCDSHSEIPAHEHVFDKTFFAKLLDSWGLYYEMNITRFRCILHQWLPLFRFPSSLEVKIFVY